MELDYAEEWKEAPDSFAVSASLPLDGRYQRGVADHRFFANLLPEADSRELLCRSLGISTDNDFELLRRVGGDCAGALSISPSETDPEQDGQYRPISQEELATAIKTRLPLTRLMTGGQLRLSLAGAQQKWPVLYKDGELFFPEGAFASSHILKFANPRFKGLPQNEAYVTFLAGQLGLPVMPVTPFEGYSLTPRYDRHEVAGLVRRYHQEDFCQALGLPFNQKYQAEGGPDLSSCAELLRKVSSQPGVDLRELLRWQILNVALGNSDGHGKNLSLLYKDGGVRLAPFYDLVCTRAYRGISRGLAMAVGDEYDPGQLTRGHWELMARDVGVKPNLVLSLLAEATETLTERLDGLTQVFYQLFGGNRQVDLFRTQVRDLTRRLVHSSLLRS